MSRNLIPDNWMPRTDMALETKLYPVPLETLRVHDAVTSTLPTTSANDDLGIIAGTYGTNGIQIQTSDLKAAGATTRYARFLFHLPPEYQEAESVVCRIAAEMVTTVADTSATVDLSVYAYDEDGTLSADLCATAAQDMNSLTLADKDFTVTATTLTPGMTLDCRIAVAVNDAATGTAVIASIPSIKMVLGVRG